MTLSSQLGASRGASLGPTTLVGGSQGQPGGPSQESVRIRKSVTVVPPEPNGDGGLAPRIRRKLSSLLRSTGDLSRDLLDETAAGLGFVRTLSLRKKNHRHDRKKKLSSQWTSYTGRSVDEETTSMAGDLDEDGVSVFGDDGSSGAPSHCGSTCSLTDDGKTPLRRAISFQQASPTLAGGVAMRPRSGSHAGHESREFRRSMGSIPMEYTPLTDGMRHQRRHSRSREHLHSAWSTSLTSLQEGVIADDLRDGDSNELIVGSVPCHLRLSHDSVLRGRCAPYDEVDGVAPALPLHSVADSINGPVTPIAGHHGPSWSLLLGGAAGCSGSLPTLPHGESRAAFADGARASPVPSLARSLSSTADKPRCLCSRYSTEQPTRSRSLTHIAALDMSGDPGPDRPDRLLVPAAGDACHSLRRQKLTSRSQLSSSEYFLVTFEVSDGVAAASQDAPQPPQPDEEYVVAAKGTTLEEALAGPCQKRGISLGGVSVFLEGCKVDLSASSLSTESSLLAGKHLRIRAKQDGKTVKSVLSRAASSQQPVPRRTSGSVRNNRRFFSTSTEDPGCVSTPPAPDFLGLESLAKTKASKQRWSGFFGNNKDTKLDALSEQLDNYKKHGIPNEHQAGPETDERLYQLEENWRELVERGEALPERLQQQQDAIWELLQTELAYIRTLTVVKDLFLACLSSLQEARILADVDKGRLFSNIVDIHAANAHFWEQYLAPVVSATRDARQPLNPHHLLDGFHKFNEIFCPYVQYCVEQSECQKYCRERTSEGELFTIYLAWCETQSACNRLRLVDILVKPMQRLTKYSLLLKAIHKKTDCAEQRQSLEYMIRRVDEFVNSVNSKLRERQDHDRLKAISARIEPYDVVESKDEDLDKMVKLYSYFDLMRPMPNCPPSQRRCLLLEGDLRFRDLNNSKLDVHCFLMTDMLLVCKTTTKKSESRTARVRVLRAPYLVERLVVQELPRDPPTLACVYLNEYRVATTAFLLTSPEAKLIKTWSDKISKAQDLYAQAKLAAASSPSVVPVQYHAPPLSLSLSRQPSSLYDEDVAAHHHEDEAHDGDTHSYASYSLGPYPQRSPRGSTRGSSLNHSHSGSVEMNEASSLSSVSHSRGVSVDNNELRASSLSSDEGIPPLGQDQAGAAGAAGAAGGGPDGGAGRAGRGLRRSTNSKSPSPNTLSIQVPVFSSLGQSLPNLNLAASSPHGSLSGPQPPSSLLLVPPSGKGLHQHHGPLSPGHRGTSYPPPSPPRGSLHRGLALAASRNPPLMKMRHVSSVGVPTQQSCTGAVPSWTGPPSSTSGTSSMTGTSAVSGASGASAAPGTSAASGQLSPTSTFDFDVPVIAGVLLPRDDQQQGAGEAAGSGGALTAAGGQPNASPRPTFMMKRLTRGDNRRYHTAGTIDDVKKAECRDASIHKRLSWNYGPQSCSKRQSHGEDGPPDVLLIDRATSPLEPPPQNITDAAWSHVHAGSTERNPFAEPVIFQSPSVGSSPSVSLCGDCGSGVPLALGPLVAGASVTSSPALSASSPIQLPSLSASPTFGSSAGPELARSNPFLEDVVGQDENVVPEAASAAADEVLVLITDAHSEYTDA